MSIKQERFLVNLVAIGDIRQAAKQSTISEAAAFRWLKDDRFRSALRSARREAWAAGMARIQSSVTRAAETLIEIMEDSEKPASARVSAAKTILDSGNKFIELHDIISRLDALERQIGAG